MGRREGKVGDEKPSKRASHLFCCVTLCTSLLEDLCPLSGVTSRNGSHLNKRRIMM